MINLVCFIAGIAISNAKSGGISYGSRKSAQTIDLLWSGAVMKCSYF